MPYSGNAIQSSNISIEFIDLVVDRKMAPPPHYVKTVSAVRYRYGEECLKLLNSNRIAGVADDRQAWRK